MYLKKLVLKNFRSYSDITIKLNNGINLIIGKNAQGKTNLIESIYFLGTGKSHRTAKDFELVHFGKEGFLILGEIQKKNSLTKIEYMLSLQKRVLKINGQPCKISDLLGNINVVIFSPEDMYLIKGGPRERRRFLDLEISQVNPTYYYNLRQYMQILQQRNRLLKEMREQNIYKNDFLEVWNEQLIETGASVIKKRIEVLNKLGILAKLMHRKITNINETMELNYVSSLQIENKDDLKIVKEKFRKALENTKKEEFYRKMTLVGPHRDDFVFQINGLDVKHFGSQGQQRTTILALKLAELEFVKSEIGDYPILLLDDVMSELDDERRKLLLESVSNKIQTIITSTNLEGFSEEIIKNAFLYKFENNKLVRFSNADTN